jgi:hypothetical protein
VASPLPVVPAGMRAAGDRGPSAVLQSPTTVVTRGASERPSLQPTAAPVANEDPSQSVPESFKKKRRFSFF